MRKYFCDSCGKEIDRPRILEVPCHMHSMKNKSGYEDGEGNRVSGKMDSIDLCNKCLNSAFSAALKAINL